MKDFEYLEPASVGEAVSALSRYQGKARLIAGGTDLLVTMKNGSTSPEYLVNIKTIPNLGGISYSDKGLVIGPLATLHDIETSPLVQQHAPILAQAASQIAAPRIRSVATIGGNLCQDTKCLYYMQLARWQQAPCYRADGEVCYVAKGAKRCQAMAIADSAPALLCLNATAVITGPGGEREIPFENFFVSSGVVSLEKDEMLTAIRIPPPAKSGQFYLRFSLRGAPDFVIAAAGAVVSTFNSTFKDVRISLLGVTRTPVRARQAEEVLNGKKADEALIEQAAQAAGKEARPIGDIFGSAAYRRKIVPVLVKRAITAALEGEK